LSRIAHATEQNCGIIAILNRGDDALFLDTEFNGFGGELILIALVPEDKQLQSFFEAIECRNPIP
jgi:hypothetical protein